MKKTLMMFAAVAVIAAGLRIAGMLPPSAHAAPPAISQAVSQEIFGSSKWQATLNGDGGSSGVSFPYCLSFTNQTVSLETQTNNTFCYRTCTTASCTADCTKDKTINRPILGFTTPDSGVNPGTTTEQWGTFSSGKIELALDKCISVSTLDGGNAGVRVFLETANPKP